MTAPRSATWVVIVALALLFALANAASTLRLAHYVLPIRVRLHFTVPPGHPVTVQRLSPNGNTHPLAYANGVWSLSYGYVTSLTCTLHAADLAALDSLEVAIGPTEHVYGGPDLGKRWHPEARGTLVTLRSPAELEVQSIFASAFHARLINYVGDGEMLRQLVWSFLSLLLIVWASWRLAFGGWPTSLPVPHPRLERLAFLGAVVFPVLLVLSTATYHGDIREFFKWGTAWAAAPGHVYLGSRANYPWLGVLATAMPAATVTGLASSGAAAIRWFRLYISLYDVATTLLLLVLLRLLVRERAFFWASVLAFTPSSWAGGSLWGQIDGLGQAEILIGIIATLMAFRLAWTRPRAATAYCALASFALAAMLLTKQLLLFAIIPLGLALAVLIVRFARKSRGLALRTGSIALLATPVAVAACDRFIEVPHGYASHLLYVYLGRGGIGANLLSSNGFNLWTFLDREHVHSGAPFAHLLNPYAMGLCLFALYWLLLAASRRRGLAALGRRLVADPDPGAGRLVGTLLLLFALFQLSANVFLAGTHERYLYHCYPYLILGVVLLLRSGFAVPTRTQALVAAGAVIYGLYVLSVLDRLPGSLFLAASAAFVAALHLALLCDVSALCRKLLATLAAEGPATAPA